MLGTLAVWQFWLNWISQIEYGWNVAGSNNKVMEVEKNKKTYFFIQSSFCQIFGEKVNFWISPAQSCG